MKLASSIPGGLGCCREKKKKNPVELPVKTSDQDFEFAVEAAESTGREWDGRHEGLL